jgi:hypothetical protein
MSEFRPSPQEVGDEEVCTEVIEDAVAAVESAADAAAATAGMDGTSGAVDVQKSSFVSASNNARENDINDFVTPVRKIFDERDLEEFKKSDARIDIVKFVSMCAKSVVGKKVSDCTETSPAVTTFVNYMTLLINLIDEIPPIPQPMRYGNKAFRQWHSRMSSESNTFLASFLLHMSPANTAAIIELFPYLTGSFGVIWVNIFDNVFSYAECLVGPNKNRLWHWPRAQHHDFLLVFIQAWHFCRI